MLKIPFKMRSFITLFAILALAFNAIQAFDMKCDFSEEERPVESGIFQHKCSTEDLDVKKPAEVVTSINGHDAAYYHDKNITILRIGEQTVHFLPTGIEKFFPNLEDISIVSCHLKSIKQSDVKPFGHRLQEFFVVFNDLDSLDSDLFEFNPEVTNINFSSNQLKSIGADILSPLKKVLHANFADNPCVDNFGGELTLKPDTTELINDFKTKCAPAPADNH